MKTIKIKEKIVDAKNGADAAYIIIHFDVKKELGSLRPKVKAVFDGKVEYQGLIARHGTPYHFLLLTKDVRAALNKGVGDEVEVEIVLDDKPRKVEVPAMLKTKLKKDKKLAQFFDSLSYTSQKEYAVYITSAKKAETQERRLEKVIQSLRDGKKRL